MTKTREMHRQIADWYLKRDADDRARLDEIAARYGLGPAADMTSLLERMTPEDAAAVTEITGHKTFEEQTREIFGDMTAPDGITLPPRLRRGQHPPDCPHCHRGHRG